jgi:hypothetical protein
VEANSELSDIILASTYSQFISGKKKKYDAVPISLSTPEPLIILEQLRRRPKAEPDPERRAMSPQECKEAMRDLQLQRQ